MISFIALLNVIVVSLMEGLPNNNYRVSSILALLISIIFSWMAVQWTFLYESFGFEEYELELWDGASFGLLSWAGAAFRVLSLFFWKQTIMTILYKGM